jgi:hypothetical protein
MSKNNMLKYIIQKQNNVKILTFTKNICLYLTYWLQKLKYAYLKEQPLFKVCIKGTPFITMGVTRIYVYVP